MEAQRFRDDNRSNVSTTEPLESARMPLASAPDSEQIVQLQMQYDSDTIYRSIPGLLRILQNINIESTYEIAKKEQPLQTMYQFQSWENHDRLKPLLDSLAHLVVSKAEGEVFALSLALTNTQVILNIASNDTVPTFVVEHLQKLWALLQQYNSIFWKAINNAKGPVTEIKNPLEDEESLHIIPNLPQEVEEAREAVVNLAFNYCILKSRKRFLKRARDTVRYEEIRIESNSVRNKSKAEFVQIANFVKAAGRGLKDTETLEKLAPSIKILCYSAHSRLKKLLEAQPQFGLNLEVPTSTQRLVKKIRKCLKPCELIDQILRAARSRRLSPFFTNRTLLVNPVKPFGTPPQLAPRVLGADYIHNSLTKSGIYQSLDTIEKLAPKTMRSPRRKYHAELSLMTYHLENYPIKAFRYIAVSKKMCACCAIWINEMNNHLVKCAQNTWSLHGSHGKFYENWSFPPRPKVVMKDDYDKLLERFYDELIRQCYHNFAVSRRRLQSDSTVASQSSQIENIPYEDQASKDNEAQRLLEDIEIVD